MDHKKIIALLPYSEPFLFVDELLEIDENGVRGTYTFSATSEFFNGHFKDFPVTPGVLLTECCAQIGVVCLGLFLMGPDSTSAVKSLKIGMSSSEMEFFLPVLPNEKVTVISKKVYFRFHKLKCEVNMFNTSGKLVCKGTIAGMIKRSDDE